MRLASVLSMTAFLGVSAAALAQNPLELTTTPVSNVTADAIASLPNGTVASINGSANTISLITTPALTVSTFTVPTPNSGLADITGGPDGNFWFTESAARQIGRITPDGTIREFSIPADAAPPQRIFPGIDHTLWATSCPFLDPLPSGCDRFIVMTALGPAEPNATLLPIRTPPNTSYGPSRCTPGADGNEWCIGNESTQHPFTSQFKIYRIGPDGGSTGFMPATGTQGSAILKGPDGNAYYTWELPGDSTGLGRITPSGMITEYPFMTGDRHSWMFGLAMGTDGNFYSADRQTGILYQFVPSTGMIRSGPIQIDVPEDLVAAGAASSAACSGGAFVVRSGGSLFGGLVYVAITAPPECTNLIAEIEALRFGGQGKVTALCHDSFASHDDAQSAVLSIELPAGSQASLEISAGVFLADGICEVSGSEVHCDAPLIEKGFDFEVRLSGVFGEGDIFLSCDSVTAEQEPSDNDDEIEDFDIGLPPAEGPPVLGLQVGTRFNFSVETKP